jgi:AraC-like DNA-binding protein/tetratricopeptide (TPR) repeat protein
MTGPLTNDQIFIRKLTEIIQANLQNENFGVNDLARESGLSLYTIGRKLFSIKKIRISQFIREVRLKRAMELLSEGTFTVSEVSYKVGFGSPAYFNKCFREFFGCTPGDLRKADINNTTQDIINRIKADKYKPAKNLKNIFLFSLPGILILITILGIAGYLIYTKLNQAAWHDNLVSSDGRISIAVMPFRNMTGDTTLNVWQESIQQGVISSLSNIKELLIRQKESVNSLLQSGGQTAYSSISPDIAGRISRKLLSTLFIYGSIEKAGNKVRVDAQLIDAKTKEVLKSFNTESPVAEENFFGVIDTISKRLANFLLISKLIKENPEWGRFPLSTNSPEALRYSVLGSKAREKKDFAGAVFWYSKSLEADSNFIDAAFGLENAYAYSGNMDGSRKLLIKNFNKRERMNTINQVYASWAYSISFEAPEENIKYLKQLQQMDDQWIKPSYELGVIYNSTGQYYNAIAEFQKTFALYRRWGIEFRNSSAWVGLGIAYHKTGQYDKERKVYRKALKYFPEEPLIFFRQVLLSYSEKDTVEATRDVEKFITALRKKGYSEAHQAKRLGDIYTEAGMEDKAEKYYRQALSLEPSNADRIKVLAGFFIDNNRNLEEAMSLIDEAIGTASSPYNYYEFMDLKGRCLLKQGRNREALEILEETYNSTPYKVWFIYSDLMKAREAVANLK